MPAATKGIKNKIENILESRIDCADIDGTIEGLAEEIAGAIQEEYFLPSVRVGRASSDFAGGCSGCNRRPKNVFLITLESSRFTFRLCDACFKALNKGKHFLAK